MEGPHPGRLALLITDSPVPSKYDIRALLVLVIVQLVVKCRLLVFQLFSNCNFFVKHVAK